MLYRESSFGTALGKHAVRFLADIRAMYDEIIGAKTEGSHKVNHPEGHFIWFSKVKYGMLI